MVCGLMNSDGEPETACHLTDCRSVSRDAHSAHARRHEFIRSLHYPAAKCGTMNDEVRLCAGWVVHGQEG